MRNLMIKITLISSVLIFMLGGVSWAQHGSGHRRVRQINHIERGESYRPSRVQNHARHRRHRSMQSHRRGFNHGVRHHRPRHHGRRYVVHHHRPIHQHNHYYSGGPWCSGFHFGGFFADPGYYFSFGVGDRW